MRKKAGINRENPHTVSMGRTCELHAGRPKLGFKCQIFRLRNRSANHSCDWRTCFLRHFCQFVSACGSFDQSEPRHGCIHQGMHTTSFHCIIYDERDSKDNISHYFTGYKLSRVTATISARTTVPRAGVSNFTSVGAAGDGVCVCAASCIAQKKGVQIFKKVQLSQYCPSLFITWMHLHNVNIKPDDPILFIIYQVLCALTQNKWIKTFLTMNFFCLKSQPCPSRQGLKWHDWGWVTWVILCGLSTCNLLKSVLKCHPFRVTPCDPCEYKADHNMK